jgi:GNAT superfamily N-acetyltransferase
MTRFSDRELYDRGAATLLASWEEVARGSAGAALVRLAGVAAALFPTEPERGVYSNALLERDLGASGRAAAADALEAAYAGAGIERFAAWVQEGDGAMRAELTRRGHAVTESTRAMALALDGVAAPDGHVELAAAAWPDYLRYNRRIGLPPGLLIGTDPAAFHVLAARLAGDDVTTGIAYDHAGDCGIFNVSTLEPARRRGLAGALTARLLADARARGCVTASIQATPMAERLYARVGFRDLGRFLEFTPAG